jgi:hypothetical protein
LYDYAKENKNAIIYILPHYSRCIENEHSAKIYYAKYLKMTNIILIQEKESNDKKFDHSEYG